ncbi:MAG TPA: serine protease [Baekduia sp.]|nr:serine protease [Baekduia sp.]
MGRGRILAGALAAGLGLTAALGCGGADKPAATLPVPTLDGAAVPKPIEAVVFVRARYTERISSGTGFVFDARRGRILTSDHAVEASPAVTVTDAGGQVLHGRILARAQCHDFAVVQLHPIPSGLQELRFADSSEVHAGQTVSSISYDAPGEDSAAAPPVRTSYGRVTRIGVHATLHRLLPPMSPLIEHVTPLGGAGSGAPLLDRSGQVVGLNTFVGYPPGSGARDGYQYAMAGNEIYRLLRELDEGPEQTLHGWQAEHRCHRRMAAIAGVPAGHTGEHDHMPDDEMSQEHTSAKPGTPMTTPSR